MKRAASVHVDIKSSDHKEGQYNTIIGVYLHFLCESLNEPLHLP